MELQQFNIDLAQQGAPLVTRDGRDVKEIHIFKTAATAFPIHAVIDGRVEVDTFTLHGHHNNVENPQSDLDLFIKGE